MREINEVVRIISEASDIVASGDSKFHGMSYEEGVQAALLWVIRDTDENPLED